MKSSFLLPLCVILGATPALTRDKSVVGILVDKLQLPVAPENPHGVVPPEEFPHLVVTPTAGWLAPNGKQFTKAKKIFSIHGDEGEGTIQGLYKALMGFQNTWSQPALLLDQRVSSQVRRRVFLTLKKVNMDACVVVVHGSRAHCVDPVEYRAIAGEKVSLKGERTRAIVDDKPVPQYKTKKKRSGKRGARKARIRVKSGTGLSTAEARRVLSKFRPQAQRCYQRKLPHRPRLEGSLTMHLLVNAKGKVIDVGVAKDHLKDRDVAACLMDELYAAKFRRSGSSQVNVEYSYSFKHD